MASPKGTFCRAASVMKPERSECAAARTIIPYLERTGWVLTGVLIPEMAARRRAELASSKFALPDARAMSFMMSKRTHLHDADGHWYPHLMFYLAKTPAADWGANLEGSPVFADDATIFGQGGPPDNVPRG